jgi:hypothetical protein
MQGQVLTFIDNGRSLQLLDLNGCFFFGNDLQIFYATSWNLKIFVNGRLFLNGFFVWIN